jgi:MoaE-MoaD fusion protein
MKIQVRYFAVVRERLGRSEETIEVPEGATVATAMDALAARHEAVRMLRPYLQVAVNQESSPGERPLDDGDELALIPPVAGGHSRHARLVDMPPSLDAVLAAVRGPGLGGLVTFTGVVRNRSHGRAVDHLEYEAYPEMAEKVFEEICEEIERFYAGTRIAIEHRAGKLGPGDVAVVIAVAAPHRAEAFRACEETIDRLKARAPIWKKEVGPDGAEWVGLGP